PDSVQESNLQFQIECRLDTVNTRMSILEYLSSLFAPGPRSDRSGQSSADAQLRAGSHNTRVDFEIYTDKIAESGRAVIRRAYEEARRREHNQLAPEHLFLSIAAVETP